MARMLILLLKQTKRLTNELMNKTNEQPNNTHEKNEVKNEQGLSAIRNMHNSWRFNNQWN